MVHRAPAPFGDDTVTTPPHDVPDRPAADHLPRGPGSDLLRDLMRRGSEVVGDHPVNRARIAAGKSPANAVWLWGQGMAPRTAAVRGVAGPEGARSCRPWTSSGASACSRAGRRIDVPGATGYLDTDYAAKGRFGIEALRDHDLVCVHVEAPDEASHEGRADAKVEALERIDRDIVGPLRAALAEYGDHRILISPDHATLLRTRAHDRAPVPWAMAGTGLAPSGYPYDEASAEAAGGPFLAKAFDSWMRSWPECRRCHRSLFDGRPSSRKNGPSSRRMPTRPRSSATATTSTSRRSMNSMPRCPRDAGPNSSRASSC